MQYDDGDWKELRARVDSLAGAVFLIAGGALTLSISVLLNLKEKEKVVVVQCYAYEISVAWYTLLSSIICFVILKTCLIAQSFMRGSMEPEKYNPTIKYTNTVAWLLGLAGLVTFIVGMYKIVVVAVGVAYA